MLNEQPWNQRGHMLCCHLCKEAQGGRVAPWHPTFPRTTGPVCSQRGWGGGPGPDQWWGLGGERGNRSDAPSGEVTLELRLMVARLTCSPSEK